MLFTFAEKGDASATPFSQLAYNATVKASRCLIRRRTRICPWHILDHQLAAQRRGYMQSHLAFLHEPEGIAAAERFPMKSIGTVETDLGDLELAQGRADHLPGVVIAPGVDQLANKSFPTSNSCIL